MDELVWIGAESEAPSEDPWKLGFRLGRPSPGSCRVPQACSGPHQAPAGPCPVRGCSMKLRSADHTLLNNDTAAAAREHYALVGNSDQSGPFRFFPVAEGSCGLGLILFSFSAANFTRHTHTTPHAAPHATPHATPNRIESSCLSHLPVSPSHTRSRLISFPSLSPFSSVQSHPAAQRS